MSLVSFDSLPENARIWVFASDAPLVGATAATLLATVDEFLQGWKAHGKPLRAARDWRDNRFLAIGIDPTAEQASGCSIDGLFRALRQLEQVVGSRLVGGGRVFYRGSDGATHVASRDDFDDLAKKGVVSRDTEVFDLTVGSPAQWRDGFVGTAAGLT